ncbi:hypothetical protein CVT24_008197 [Panaeolus cyanescens]|uniref:Uncharacterized protein n=1 Tax=Panaeolus cyanescens TaxID=181874 RepID=A0A409YR62_9AGAR|nr:hypothetical protein CVT24_008197 [Panaeolus cyanescens]
MDYTHFVVIYASVLILLAVFIAFAFWIGNRRRARSQGFTTSLVGGGDGRDEEEGVDGRDEEEGVDGCDVQDGADGRDKEDNDDVYHHAQRGDGRNDRHNDSNYAQHQVGRVNAHRGVNVAGRRQERNSAPYRNVNNASTNIRFEARYGYIGRRDVYMRVNARYGENEHELCVDVRQDSA